MVVHVIHQNDETLFSYVYNQVQWTYISYRFYKAGNCKNNEWTEKFWTIFVNAKRFQYSGRYKSYPENKFLYFFFNPVFIGKTWNFDK